MIVLEHGLQFLVGYAILFFEYIGVLIIILTGLQGIKNCFRKELDTRMVLAKGLALGLEFKLGSEILRTVIVRELSELYIVAGVIILRAVLAFLIHWEMKNDVL